MTARCGGNVSCADATRLTRHSRGPIRELRWRRRADRLRDGRVHFATDDIYFSASNFFQMRARFDFVIRDLAEPLAIETDTRVNEGFRANELKHMKVILIIELN